MPRDKHFDLRDPRHEHGPVASFSVARLKLDHRLVCESVWKTHRAAPKEWATLAGAKQAASRLDLHDTTHHGQDTARIGDIAIVVIHNRPDKPGLLIVQAREGHGLEPGDAFERAWWRFRRDAQSREWDIV